MDEATTYEILCSAKKAALITLSLHEQLVAVGHHALARLVWVVYLEASTSAEQMAAVLGIDPEME